MMYMNGMNVTMEKNLTVSKNLVVTGTATIAGTAVSSGTIADNVVITANHTFTQAGTGAFTTASGTNTLNGHVAIAANKKIRPLAGSGWVDLGLMTGKLMGPSGETDLNVTKVASLTVNGTSLHTGVATFTVGPLFNAGFILPTGQSISTAATVGAGSVNFGGMSGTLNGPGGATTLNSTTIKTGHTLNTVDNDALTVNSVIVPVIIPVKYNFDKNTSYNRSYEALDGAWQVVEIDESHSVVASSGCTLYVGKATGTQTPTINGATRGVSLTAAAISLTSTVNTVVQPGLNATSGNTIFATHERLFVDFVGGNVGSVVGQVTIWMKRI